MGPGPAGEVGGFLKKRGYCRSFYGEMRGSILQWTCYLDSLLRGRREVPLSKRPKWCVNGTEDVISAPETLENQEVETP